ncbi:flagellar biosynthesis protein FlhA [Turneriella parva]|uniref:Type III secretion FHIPEP protein n=1 Tax=Turneriella parva (strain ATCC BAA-1111 / DSM 21527 / NCTC 11395 / H) TaxID=869212 RepID=I4B2Q4_TURPD|nr:flagellar biosynthesis protein FlhA [Turneriella parva]AFM11561.1 type III secretion FHIPEP protein [Turneriella parva DSM 21527]
MKKWYQQGDIMLGVAVIAVVAMLIVPLPALLLDFLLAISIMISIVALLTAMFNREISEFSVFPTLLLVTTVYRLALNVSSTRLILAKGPAFEGQLIRAFGEFVVGGNYVIGFVVFIILVLVQMMVITKGATRISEVSARFALDALPGRQMALEADMTSGRVTEEEGTRRKEALQREVDFYGQMDGATKFVQGDVRVGLIITAINVIGGLIIGMAMRGESLQTALKTYTLLTIGDGLVAQIPSLLITVATGMVVTRAGAKNNLTTELSSQMFQNARALYITAGALFVASLVPGFPKLSLWVISLFLGFLAYNMRQQKMAESQKQEAIQEQQKVGSTERFLDELAVDPLKIEIGFNLVPLLDRKQGGTLLDRITNLRQKMAADLGMIVPPVRINDNLDLDGNEYVILIGGIEVARTKVYPEYLGALTNPNVREEIQPTSADMVVNDPAFGQRVVLIDPEKKREAEEKGYVVIDASTMMITHLQETFRAYAPQIMGREEVKLLLDKTKQKYPSVVDEVTKLFPNPGVLLSILHNLLRENVSIRNLPAILETLADYGGRVNNAELLTDMVRQRLARQIVAPYQDKNKAIFAAVIDPQIEYDVRGSITIDDRDGRILAIDPHYRERLRSVLLNAYNTMQTQGRFPLFVCGSEVRSSIAEIISRETSTRSFAVIAYEEIPRDAKFFELTKVILDTSEVNA